MTYDPYYEEQTPEEELEEVEEETVKSYSDAWIKLVRSI
jgi:hypothetical protein